MENTNCLQNDEKESLINTYETLSPAFKNHILMIARTLSFAQETLLQENILGKKE